MPQVNPTCFHISASSISSLKACPQRFRLNYREGLRPAADTDSQRMGTNWHSMHEEYAHEFNMNFQETRLNGQWEIEQRAKAGELALAAVVEHLNARYEKMPNTKTPFEWGLERQILLTSFVGYLWYWQNDPIEVLASEVAFDLPVHNPRLGLPLPMSEVKRVGKIDHVVRWQGMVGNMERKSTTRGIGSDSDYWDKAKKDTQVSMYALAFRDMQGTGTLGTGPNATPFVVAGETRFGNTLYDVWHKPTIKPKDLSQKETAAFFESGEYFGQTFKVERHYDGGNECPMTRLEIDGEGVDWETGKSGGISIKETVGMYAARLLADIYERPDFYFARREIARTDQEIRKFRFEVYNLYQTMKTFSKSGHWYENESQCRATFPCPFIPICYGAGADAVCDGKTTPPGFKRIFVDLTVNGESLEE